MTGKGSRTTRACRTIAAFAAMLLMALVNLAAAAGIPADYAPMVIEPNVKDGKSEFDLTAAQSRARLEKKRLYVYLGASDCPYCRVYETFLRQNTQDLVAEFARDYLIVDLRSSLSVKAGLLYFKVGAKSFDYKAFMERIGDERARLLVYPSVWLFDAELKPLLQMPAGAGTFQTVPEQLEILRLVQ
jgi:thioredoxin-related protein